LRVKNVVFSLFALRRQNIYPSRLMPSIAYKIAKATATRAALDAQAEHRKMIMAARRANQRAMAAAQNDEERQAALRKIHRSEKAWRIEQKYQICLMELEGHSVTQIATALDMSPGAVGNILSKAHRQRSKQTAQAIDLHRAILLRSAELIIKRYAPIALDDDLCARIARGESVGKKSVNHAMRAALVMLAAMEFERRILGLSVRNDKGPPSPDQKELLEWIRRHAPAIEELAKSAPSDQELMGPMGQAVGTTQADDSAESAAGVAKCDVPEASARSAELSREPIKVWQRDAL
jgi:hypothetical protein